MNGNGIIGKGKELQFFSLLEGEEKFFEPLGHRTISSIKIFLALKHDTQQFRILLLPRLIDSQIVLLLKSSELAPKFMNCLFTMI